METNRKKYLQTKIVGLFTFRKTKLRYWHCDVRENSNLDFVHEISQFSRSLLSILITMLVLWKNQKNHRCLYLYLSLHFCVLNEVCLHNQFIFVKPSGTKTLIHIIATITFHTLASSQSFIRFPNKLSRFTISFENYCHLYLGPFFLQPTGLLWLLWLVRLHVLNKLTTSFKIFLLKKQTTNKDIDQQA